MIDIEAIGFSDGNRAELTGSNGNTVVTFFAGVSAVKLAMTVLDSSEAHAWTDYTSTYGADGTTLTDQAFNYDDGRVLDREYDTTGVRTSQTRTDVDDAYSWASYTQTFATDGTLIGTVYVDDFILV